jgi:SsrA-binding protein
MTKKDKTQSSATIAKNKRALHEYFIEERFEAGIILQGWEVKSLRAGRLQLSESYVVLKNGEAWLLGSLISPLPTVSTHLVPEQDRTRKLLLHDKELRKLIGAVERKGYSLIPLSMYWKKGLAKIEIALAKGKKTYDKRATLKERDWQLQKARLMRNR